MTTHSALLEILQLQLGTKFLLKEELFYHFANASSAGGNDEMKDLVKNKPRKKCYISVKLENLEAEFLGSWLIQMVKHHK